MKKIIYFFGILFLVIITILNLTFVANLDATEHITINFNSFIYIIGLILLGTFLYFISIFINRYLYKNEHFKLKKYLFVFVIIIYIVFNIVWVITINPAVVGDQVHAWNLAQTFYRGNLEEFLPNLTYAGIPLSEYMQAYHQQISLSFVFSILFRITFIDGFGVLRALNVISNLLIFVALYKIGRHLSKSYKFNKVLLLLLFLTFISIPMLSTFIYGDTPSLALCLFSVYFMMRYSETKKLSYPIIASIFTMIAYMMRMNSLIFIIATVIYLLLNLFKDGFLKKSCKENLLKTCIIIFYICVSIFPASFVKSYYLNKYNLDNNKAYPNISYFLMAMEESPKRGNGWYNEDRGEYALKNPESAKKEYISEIKERLSYFSKNLGYTFDFYIMKISSMWTENTYSAVRNNTTSDNDILENAINPLTFYQKTLLILLCICSLIVLLQNRKKLSLDILFLLTIFIGGFAFHILWEAKSRYIIPYIVVLIPIASIELNKLEIKDKLIILFKKFFNKL